MTQREQLTMLGVAVLLLAALAIGLAWPGRAAVPGVINVTATRTYSAYHYVPPHGRQSDSQEEAWRITNHDGHTVGRMIMRCRWVVRAARLCNGELLMPLGKITFNGSSPTAFEAEYAVTGGTDAYLGVGGVMRFTAIGQRKNALLVTVTT